MGRRLVEATKAWRIRRTRGETVCGFRALEYLRFAEVVPVFFAAGAVFVDVLGLVLGWAVSAPWVGLDGAGSVWL